MKRENVGLYLMLIVFCISVASYTEAAAENATPEKAFDEHQAGNIDAANKTLGQLSDNYRAKALTMINDAEAEGFWTNFGVGLMVNKDLGSNKPPKKTKVVNGIVRVEEENDVKYGMGLEVHKFMWGWTFNNKKISDFSSSIAVGPYVGILPGAQEVFDVIGAGIMVGFFGGSKSAYTYMKDGKTNSNGNTGENKESAATPTSGSTSVNKGGRWSMNLAVGCYMDPDTEVLAPGFRDGQPPPNGETEVGLKKITQYGLQGILSFSTTF